MHVPSLEIGANNMLLGAQNKNVQVAVRASLTADEKIDGPTSGYPPFRPTSRKKLATVFGRQWHPRPKVLISHWWILAPGPVAPPSLPLVDVPNVPNEVTGGSVCGRQGGRALGADRGCVLNSRSIATNR